jgi:hypothetical protein
LSQPRQRLYRFPGLLLSHTQLVKALQIQPELRARAEKMRQTQGSVAGDRALTVQNPGNTVGGNSQLARQFGGAHAEFL